MREMGELEKAIEIFDHVLLMDPKNSRALHSKGDVFDLMGRYEEAVSCYKSALVYDPDNSETWYNLGITLSKIGYQDESEECIHRGVSLAT